MWAAAFWFVSRRHFASQAEDLPRVHGAGDGEHRRDHPEGQALHRGAQLQRESERAEGGENEGGAQAAPAHAAQDLNLVPGRGVEQELSRLGPALDDEQLAVEVGAVGDDARAGLAGGVPAHFAAGPLQVHVLEPGFVPEAGEEGGVVVTVRAGEVADKIHRVLICARLAGYEAVIQLAGVSKAPAPESHFVQPLGLSFQHRPEVPVFHHLRSPP